MNKTVGVTVWIILIEIFGLWLIQKREIVQPPINKITQIPTSTPTQVPTKTNTRNEIIPTIRPKSILVKTITPTPTIDNEPWGVSKQVGEHTWTMKVGEDTNMATAKEVFEAINEYRKVQGSQVLTWSQKLGDYAQERAVYLNKIKSVDQHEGFSDYLKNQDGFNKLGFTTLGENISYGYRLTGVHLIEWMYAGDQPHNDNQLDNRWNYVGIGVEGLATCLIFGTGKF